MKILIVDDIPANRKLLRAQLEAENHTVVDAADGVEAFLVLEQEAVDAIISDILMPNMDGYRFCYEVRQDKRFRHLPLIHYSSTYLSPGDEKLSLSSGADRFIRKPVSPSVLLKALEEILAQPGRQPPPASAPQESEFLRSYNERLVSKLEERNAALTESEERFRQMAEAINEVFWLAARSGDVLYISPAYESIWGRASYSLYTNPNEWLEAVHPDERARVIAAMAENLRGTPTDVEFRIVRPDGAVRWIQNKAYPVTNSEGQVYRVAGVAEDITERRLASEQLANAIQELERSSAELQQFAYVSSHDLQEPLRKITAFSERIRTRVGTGLDEQSRDYFRRMEGAAVRMRELVEGLLAYSRVSTRGTGFARVDVEAVVRKVVADLDAQVQGQQGRVEIEPLPAVMGDAIQIQQLFRNLIHNAVKFRRTEVSPLVRVFAKPVEAGVVEISVEDNGVGFDEKYLDRIFHPFQRLHGREFEGTGMGLTICRKIVERHNGRITARSAPGCGSIFILTLPIAL